MKLTRAAAVAISMIVTAPTGLGQSTIPPRTATDVTSADLTAVLAKLPPDGVSDQQIRVVDIGKYNVAVGVLHRGAKAKQNAIEHSQVTEIYHVIRVDADHVLPAGYVHPTMKR